VKKTKKMSALELATLDLEAFQQQEEPLQERPDLTVNPSIQHLKVHPDEIMPAWFLNRQPWDMGNIASLEMNMASGQAVPILLRPTLTENAPTAIKYDLIYGFRRWEVARRCGMELDAIVEVLSDDDAIRRMWKENEDREGISAYSEALHYKKIKDEKKLSIREMASLFELAKSTIEDALKLLRVPEEFWDAIGDRSAVGKKLGSEIVDLWKETPEHKTALLTLAPKIGQGKIGSRTLRQAVNQLIKPRSPSKPLITTHRSERYGLAFKTHYDKSGTPTFKISKKIAQQLAITEVEKDLLKLLEKHLRQAS